MRWSFEMLYLGVLIKIVKWFLSGKYFVNPQRVRLSEPTREAAQTGSFVLDIVYPRDLFLPTT